MELIEIVDKNGNFTGQVIDKEEAHDKNLLHNEVAVFREERLSLFEQLKDIYKNINNDNMTVV